MKLSHARSAVFVMLLMTMVVVNARASDAIGIYTLVEKVIFEPNETAPERIQIWGVFALSDAQHGDNYQAPQRGYLYYSLPRINREAALKEWADFKRIAGTGEAVGFGGRYLVTGRVRKASDKLENPDVYPIQVSVGMVKMEQRQFQAETLKKLREVQKKK
jgi:type IV secretory pathway protease TraF